MTNITEYKELLRKERTQLRVFASVSAGAVGLAVILRYSNEHLFQRFVGNIDPLLAALSLVVLGFLSLVFLHAWGGLAVYMKGDSKGVARSAWLALLFVSVTILVDLNVPFSADMNVPFPEALLFYPVIGFFAEILFHVLPLALLLIVLAAIVRGVSHQVLLWICIPIIAVVEPVYHLIPMIVADQFPLWAIVVVGINLYLFNLAQLFIFKRYDFIAMYAFRLVYYLVWHLIWGYARLKVLF